VGNEELAESVRVLEELGYRQVWPGVDESTRQEGWHPPLEPGEYYVETWMPDWAGYNEQNVIHVEEDPARPLPPGLELG
jgi:hypothetical protein